MQCVESQLSSKRHWVRSELLFLPFSIFSPVLQSCHLFYFVARIFLLARSMCVSIGLCLTRSVDWFKATCEFFWAQFMCECDCLLLGYFSYGVRPWWRWRLCVAVEAEVILTFINKLLVQNLREANQKHDQNHPSCCYGSVWENQLWSLPPALTLRCGNMQLQSRLQRISGRSSSLDPLLLDRELA